MIYLSFVFLGEVCVSMLARIELVLSQPLELCHVVVSTVGL